MNSFAMFPGQGSQFVGMGEKLFREFPEAKKIFEEANSHVGFELSKICFEGPPETLQLTEFTQPAILTVSIAMFEIAKGQNTFDGFAGHSLGEYSALVASGRMKFCDAVKLVHARGKFMQKAVPVGVGAMAAVLSDDVVKIRQICAEITDSMESVEIANYNSPQQLVIAGNVNAVEKVEQKLRTERIKCIRLQVSAPFHSRLMVKARENMAPLIEQTEFYQQETVIIPNFNAEIIREYKKEFLTKQIDSPVLWTQTLATAVQGNFKKFVEVGPGKVLQGLFKKNITDQEVTCEGLDFLI